MNRLAERLARDVPEGDVDAGDHLHPRALPAVIGEEAVHLLPEPLALQRILADQRRPQGLHADLPTGGRLDDRPTDVRLRLDVRPPGNAFIRADFDERDEPHAVRLARLGGVRVILAGIEHDRFHIGDLHRVR